MHRRRRFGDIEVIFMLIGFGFAIYPSIVLPIVFVTIYILLRLSVLRNLKWESESAVPHWGRNTEEIERRKALKEAQIYLAPYKNIWGDLRLSNHYCSLYLDQKGVTISGKEKRHPYRTFKIVYTKVHTNRELWNLFCRYFSYNTHYEGLIESCDRFGAKYVEEYGAPDSSAPQNALDMSGNEKLAPETDKELVDINNCSEIELTELPGISIVMAKKIIKKREEIGGFKNTAEFFAMLNLKQHMVFRLQKMVKVEPMRGYVKKELNSERHLDL